MASYTKPYLAPPQQLQLLKTRGLQVADDVAAIECLRRNGYYRLSAYWYLFRRIDQNSFKRTDTFLSDSHFENAVELYKFDKKLKLLLFDAIERVEIAVRVEISLVLGRRDPFAHTNPYFFDSNFTAPGASGKSAYDT